MTKEEIKFVSDLVVTTLGIPATEVASLLFEIKEDETGDVKPTALQSLFDKSAVRVATFKEAETKAHDKGYNKAKAESISKFENDLKEKFGVTSEKQGIELIELVVSEKLKTQGGELDEQKIKRSTEYLTMVDRLTKEKNDAVIAETNKFKELQDSLQKESTFKTISEQANAWLDEMNPILPTGKTADGKSRAEIQRANFLKMISSEYGFEIKDGKTLVTDKDGKILEDKHGNMVDFKEIVKSKASELWDFQEGQARAGTGNKNDGDAGAEGVKKAYTGAKPKDEAEFVALVQKAKTPEERQGIVAAWKEAQTATT